MAKVLRCRDVGFDCEAVVRAETEEDILNQAVAHAREVHGIQKVPDDVVQQAIASIRTEPAA